MRIVIGLGNPGKKYEKTRHNIGFRVLDALAENLNVTFQPRAKFYSEIATVNSGKEKNLLVKPQTFVNESGRAIAALKNFYKLSNQDVLVVQDEIDLEFGRIKLSKNRGSAGHRGIESIMEKIDQSFARLRIGIEGRKSRKELDTYDYVLTNFTEEEEEKLKNEIIPKALEEIKSVLNPTNERKALLDKPVLP